MTLFKRKEKKAKYTLTSETNWNKGVMETKWYVARDGWCISCFHVYDEALKCFDISVENNLPVKKTIKEEYV